MCYVYLKSARVQDAHIGYSHRYQGLLKVLVDFYY